MRWTGLVRQRMAVVLLLVQQRWLCLPAAQESHLAPAQNEM